MDDLNTLQAYGEELEKRLRLKTSPIAIMILQSAEDIPSGAIRPVRDIKQKMALCVGLMKARRNGQTVAMLMEDMWCVDPVIGLGMAEPPESFLSGKGRFPSTISCIAAGKIWSQAFPRLPSGRNVGIVMAPLKKTGFMPDIVVIYSDVAQLAQLVISAGWKEGKDVNARMSGFSACVYATVPTLLTADYHVTPPCPGDARHAMAQDDEIIFTVPIGKMDDLMDGLRFMDEMGAGLPRALSAENEFSLPQIYRRIGKDAGMDI